MVSDEENLKKLEKLQKMKYVEFAQIISNALGAISLARNHIDAVVGLDDMEFDVDRASKLADELGEVVKKYREETGLQDIELVDVIYAIAENISIEFLKILVMQTVEDVENAAMLFKMLGIDIEEVKEVDDDGIYR